MASVDTDRLEAQLNALEESLFKLGTRAELAGSKADAAARELANLYAQQAAGANVSAAALQQAQAALAGLDAEVLNLSGRSAGLEELLAQMRELGGEAAVRLAPAFRDLVKLAGEAADAEAARARGLAALPALEAAVAAAEANLAQARAAGAGEGQAMAALSRAQGNLGRAQEAQRPLDVTAAAAAGRYQRGAAQLGERVSEAQAGRGAGAGAAAQEALGGLVGAVNTTTLAFGLASAAVVGSVQAFSPAIVEQFNMALRDLSAVVGEALAPVLQGLTTIAREVGAVLQPAMRALAPVFETLTATVLQVLLPVIDTWASVFQDLIPVINFFAEVFSNVGTIARVGGAFLAGWIELLRQGAAALAGWIGGLTGLANPAQSFTDWLKTALQSVGEAAILAAGYLAKLVGATGFLDGMIKSLSKAPGKPGMAAAEDITGKGAAQNARVTTGADFEKSALAAAFVATGGGPEKKDTSDWLAEVVKQLEAIKAGDDNKVQQFLDKLNQLEILKAIKDALQTIADIREGVGHAREDALDAAKHGVGFLANPTLGGAAIGKLLAEAYPGLFGR